MRRGFKSECEELAITKRKELGLSANVRLPARTLLRSVGAMITTPSLIPGIEPEDLDQLTETDEGSWSALTTMFDGIPIVIHNDAHGVRRQESNLHHEAAHILCGHEPCHLQRVGSMTFRTFDEEAEKEASWLAGCLHLPRVALISALRAGRSDDEISTAFVASAEMVAFRRRLTGVDRQLRTRS